MAFNLRLPPALESIARARAETIGISVNAVICVALSAYLDTPEPIVPGPSGRKPTGRLKKPGKVSPAAPGQPLIPRPEVGPKPTKKELAALFNWQRDQLKLKL